MRAEELLNDSLWTTTARLDPRWTLRRVRDAVTGDSDTNRLRRAVAGKRVLVTGASAGIGREVAVSLAGAGAEVLAVARRESALAALAEHVRAAGGAVHPLPCDLAEREAVDQLAARVLEEFDGVDVLVNNAGRSIRRTVEESTDRPHDFERVMRVNYFGAVRLTLPLVARMRERGDGHVVYVSTLATQLRAQPRFAAYLASKSAMEALMRSAAPETRADGVDWTVVHMPLVRTEMIAPTAIYRQIPAMTPAQGAAMVLDAIARRPVRVSHPLGVALGAVELVAPSVLNRAMARTFSPAVRRWAQSRTA